MLLVLVYFLLQRMALRDIQYENLEHNYVSKRGGVHKQKLFEKEKVYTIPPTLRLHGKTTLYADECWHFLAVNDFVPCGWQTLLSTHRSVGIEREECMIHSFMFVGSKQRATTIPTLCCVTRTF